MRLNKILSVLPLALVITFASTQAVAQKGGIAASKVGRHGSINVGIGFVGSLHRPSFPSRVNCYPPVVIVEPCRRWVPACYETRCVQVWVPCVERQVWCEPVYETVCDPCCGTRQVLVKAGFFRTVVVSAGHYETQTTRVLVSRGYFV